MSSSGGPSATALFPRLRVGRRWLNLLWTIPAAVVIGAIGVAVAIWLRTLPSVDSFVETYPGTVVVDAPTGFPWWLRWQHLLNAIFLVPIVRAGVQLWAGRPRVYWTKPATPGRDWLRIQNAMPAEGGWSMRDDAVGTAALVGLPGKRLSSGLARWWHLSVTLLWVANGILFYVLVFATGQWRRLIPTTWEVVPNALSAGLQYLSLDFPAQNSWVAYNSLQLITYFITVFVAAPLAVLTGLMHSPFIAKKLKTTNSKWLNAEVGRSVHILVLAWFVLFTIAHVSLVLLTGALENLNHITIGTQGTGWTGLVLFAIYVVVGGVAWVLLSPLTLKFPNAVQKAGAKLLGPLAKWL